MLTSRLETHMALDMSIAPLGDWPDVTPPDLQTLWDDLLQRSDQLDWLDRDGLGGLGYTAAPGQIEMLHRQLLMLAQRRVQALSAERSTMPETLVEELASVTRVLQFLGRSSLPGV